MATRTCADTSYAEVNNCVNGVAGGTNQFNTIAPDGTIVVVPAGTSTWSSTLTYSNRITLQGSTTVTGITRSHGGSGLTANDQTIILDGCLNNAGNRSMIVATFDDGDVSGGADGFHPRITGLTLRQASSTGEASGGNSYGAYAIVIQGINKNTRIDNMHFDRLHHYSYLKQGDVKGVNDHSVFDQFYGKDLNNKNVQIQELVEIWDDAYGATSLPSGYGFQGSSAVSTSYGNQSWVEGPNLTSNQQKFWYVEDCQFNNNWDGTAGAYSPVGCSIDSSFAARFVSRYCDFPNGGIAACHGTETGGQRGARAIVCLRNSYTFPSAIGATNIGDLIRSGTRLSIDCDYHGTTVTAGPCGLTAARQAQSKTFGVSDGRNPWDLVDTDGIGTIGLGTSLAHVFKSGTATSTTANNTIIDTAGTFTDNQWNGYQATNDTQLGTKATESSFVTATAASTSKLSLSASTGGQTFTTTSGDSYSLRKNLLTLDQAGRGSGDSLVGVNTNGSNVTMGGSISVQVKSWPHQVLEPCYSVGNTLNASSIAYDSTKIFNGFFHSSYPTMIVNRDYYNETASFNGTSGTGRGVLASRPGTGTNGTDIASGYYTLAYNPLGTAYWATDQGSWNTSGDGRGSGKLQAYVNGAWTDYFIPYTYPHPLVQAPTGKITSLSGNMTFGNVITNTTAQSTLSIFNTGDTTLTVTSITYPTGYTGAYSGTIAAGASHDVTVTFAPVSQIAYNGTITVNSDATAGTNTIAATGAGTAPPITNTPNPGREKSAARRITGIGRRM